MEDEPQGTPSSYATAFRLQLLDMFLQLRQSLIPAFSPEWLSFHPFPYHIHSFLSVPSLSSLLLHHLTPLDSLL